MNEILKKNTEFVNKVKGKKIRYTQWVNGHTMYFIPCGDFNERRVIGDLFYTDGSFITTTNLPICNGLNLDDDGINKWEFI